VIREKATGAMDSTWQAGRYWLMDGNRARAAMVRRNVRVVWLTVRPLVLLALTMSHLVDSTLALVVKDFAVPFES